MLPPPEQLSTVQVPPPDADKDPIEAGKGKEVQPPAEAKQSEYTLTIKDVVSTAKETESKSKAVDPEEKPPLAKAQTQDYLLQFSLCIIFCSGILPLDIMYFLFYLMERLFLFSLCAFTLCVF